MSVIILSSVLKYEANTYILSFGIGYYDGIVLLETLIS